MFSEREKFYPGPGIEPGSPNLCAGTLSLSYPGQYRSMAELFSYSYPLFGPGADNRLSVRGQRRVTIRD